METMAKNRLARLAGLFVLSLLVVSIAVQAAQADPLVRTGPGTPIVAPALAHQGGATSTTPLAGTQGRGGVSQASVTTPSGVPPASSSLPSTTAWIVVGSVAAVILLLFEWALLRRRSSAVTAETFCEQRPDSGLCRTG